MGCRQSKQEAAPLNQEEKPEKEAASTAITAKAFPAAQAADNILPENTKIFFVLGGPGSGKGTQCERIVAKYGYKHLSAGDLLRDEVKSGSDLGKQCEHIMKEGKLVPMEVIIGLLKTAMVKSSADQFLIDGFPRALDQAEAFERMVKPCEAVLFFDCPEEVMEQRLLKRGETSGRSDDNAETIRKRFKTFVEQSLPVIDHYEQKGKAFRISAVPAPDQVFVEVQEAIDSHHAKAKEQQVPNIEEQQVPEDTSIVFVLGGPGSGKGTQCERIVAKYGYKHLSAGDLLRDEVKSGSELGKRCEHIMKEGKLVPMEVIIGLLKTAMINSKANEFLIDGFPRALDQAEAFERMVKPCEAVLFFDCPEEVMEQRLLKRGETSGRSDDNAETIRKRFKTFVEQSLPVIDVYEEQGKAFRISAVPSPDEVFLEVQKAIESKGMVMPEVTGSLPEDATIIFVLGGPGSGKGTQCERIVAKYGYTHFSAGDLLRAEVKSGSAVGKKCEQIMREGKLVPMEVTINLLKAAMVKSDNKEFLIDGFPRAMDQAEAFERMIQPCKSVLFFDCPEEVMEQRLLKRGETSGRSDDNAETIRKRFQTFVEQSLPVIDHYERQGKAFRISAVPAPDQVFLEVQKAIEGPSAAAAAAPAEPERAPPARQPAPEPEPEYEGAQPALAYA